MSVAVQKTTQYRPEIDGLRALAVISVILYHVGLFGITGGFVGVDVFFTLSGYLITNLLLNEVQKNERIDLPAFYARRIRRLFPALFVVVLVTLVFWSFMFPGQLNEIGLLAKSARYSIFGFGNLYFLNHTGGYFDPSTSLQPMLHLWSLGVEEQFYLIWPLFIFGIFRVCKRYKLEMKKTSFFLLLSFSVFSFLGAFFSMKSGNANNAFYMAHLRGWELSLGGCLVLVEDMGWFEFRIQNRPIRELGSGLGLIGVLSSIVFYSDFTPFPGVTAIVPVLGTVTLLAFVQRTSIGTLLSLRLIAFFGLISYSWYLWHWPIFTLFRNYNVAIFSSVFLKIILVLVSFVFSCLSYYFVETPIRYSRSMKWKPARIIAIGVMGGLFVMASGAALVRADMVISFFRYGADGLKVFAKIAEHTSYYSECFDPPKEKPDFSKCITSSKLNESVIAVIGNSHANSFFSMAEEYVKSAPAAAAMYARVGYFLPMDEHAEDAVQKFDRFVLNDLKEKISQNPNRKVSVILASRFSALPPYLKVSDFGLLLKRSITELNQIGVYRILVVLPYPEFPLQAGRCFQLNSTDLSRCSVDLEKLKRVREDGVGIVKRVVAGFKNVEFLDPVEVFCNQKSCLQFFNTGDQIIPLTYDDNHPSVVAASYLSKVRKSQLDWLLEK